MQGLLPRQPLERAVRLQACGYRLLRWLELAMRDGVVSPDAAGQHAASTDAAAAWIERHWLNLPVAARPERADLRAFANLFCTYLTSTFRSASGSG